MNQLPTVVREEILRRLRMAKQIRNFDPKFADIPKAASEPYDCPLIDLQQYTYMYDDRDKCWDLLPALETVAIDAESNHPSI